MRIALAVGIALALGISGAVVAGPRGETRGAVARIEAMKIDAHLLAALERAPTPLARRVVRATWGREPAPIRFGQGGGKPRVNAFRKR